MKNFIIAFFSLAPVNAMETEFEHYVQKNNLENLPIVAQLRANKKIDDNKKIKILKEEAKKQPAQTLTLKNTEITKQTSNLMSTNAKKKKEYRDFFISPFALNDFGKKSKTKKTESLRFDCESNQCQDADLARLTGKAGNEFLNYQLQEGSNSYASIYIHQKVKEDLDKNTEESWTKLREAIDQSLNTQQPYAIYYE